MNIQQTARTYRVEGDEEFVIDLDALAESNKDMPDLWQTSPHWRSVHPPRPAEAPRASIALRGFRDDPTDLDSEDTMTKQHFIWFANYIRTAPLTPDHKRQLATMVIAAGANFNGQFSPQRFLEAAGLSPMRQAALTLEAKRLHDAATVPGFDPARDGALAPVVKAEGQ
jgi:hypothetical protein